MIKEAINRILALSTPNTMEYDGRVFVDKLMTQLPKYRLADSLDVHTLSAIVDYIKRKSDSAVLDDGRFIVHVQDFNRVSLLRELNADKKRECLITAGVDNCNYPFGRFIDLENFIINLQANFVSDENTRALIALSGNIVSESGITQADDGVSQRVTAKTGIALVNKVDVPNPISLMPYRTFTEIEQPASDFVFRLRKDGDEVNAALFAADGQEWKRIAILSISAWFAEQLSENDNVIILA